MKKLLRKVFPRLNADGSEKLDPTPAAIPLGFRKPPSLAEQVASLVRSHHLRAELDRKGIETFEEADDFEVGDDYDPTTPYETDFDHATIAASDMGYVAPPVASPADRKLLTDFMERKTRKKKYRRVFEEEIPDDAPASKEGDKADEK